MLVYLLLAALAVVIIQSISDTLSTIESFGGLDESGSVAPGATGSCTTLANQNAGNIGALRAQLAELTSPASGGIRDSIAKLTAKADANAAQLREMANEIHNQANKLIAPPKDGGPIQAPSGMN
jgi:hypothetical protein